MSITNTTSFPEGRENLNLWSLRDCSQNGYFVSLLSLWDSIQLSTPDSVAFVAILLLMSYFIPTIYVPGWMKGDAPNRATSSFRLSSLLENSVLCYLAWQDQLTIPQPRRISMPWCCLSLEVRFRWVPSSLRHHESMLVHSLQKMSTTIIDWYHHSG